MAEQDATYPADATPSQPCGDSAAQETLPASSLCGCGNSRGIS